VQDRRSTASTDLTFLDHPVLSDPEPFLVALRLCNEIWWKFWNVESHR